jgi:large subunit ribosomal protein L31
MQKNIHPTYHSAAKAACVCGATYVVGSTKDTLNVEICSACHPFYTGKENILDTAGRLDRFKKRQATATTLKAKKAAK